MFLVNEQKKVRKFQNLYTTQFRKHWLLFKLKIFKWFFFFVPLNFSPFHITYFVVPFNIIATTSIVFFCLDSWLCYTIFTTKKNLIKYFNTTLSIINGPRANQHHKNYLGINIILQLYNVLPMCNIIAVMYFKIGFFSFIKK